MMYEPSLSAFMYAAFTRAGDYAARMCVCSSRAAAVATMMIDAMIERKRVSQEMAFAKYADRQNSRFQDELIQQTFLGQIINFVIMH